MLCGLRVVVCLLVACLGLLSSGVNASVIDSFEIEKSLIKSTDGDVVTLKMDMPYVDGILNQLWPRTRNYPPRFETGADRQQAWKNLKLLTKVFEVLLSESSNKDLIWRAALANHMAFNLDLEGSH